MIDGEPCFNNTECGDGREADKDFVQPSEVLREWWGGFSDPHTLVTSYSYCVGSSRGSCDIVPMVSNITGTSAAV